MSAQRVGQKIDQNLDRARDKVEYGYDKVKHTVERGYDKVANGVEHGYEKLEEVAADTRDKVRGYVNKLRRSDWTSFEEDALRFGETLALFIVPALVQRPFRNLQIKQILDTHGPNQVPQYNGFVQGFKQIVREDGFMGLFKGNAGQYFYEILGYTARRLAVRYSLKYVPIKYFDLQYLPLLGLGIDALVDIATYPISTATTRIVAQPGYTKYDGVLDTLSKISHENLPVSRKDEIDLNPFKPTWYAGFTAHVLSVTAHTFTEALALYLFDKAFGYTGDIVAQATVLRVNPVPAVKVDVEGKNVVDVNGYAPIKETDYAIVVRNPICAFIGLLAAHPFKVVSKRQQAGLIDYKNKGVFEALSYIVEREGYYGLFKGLLFN